MNVLSRYSFISAYNTDQMTSREAVSAGVSTSDFSKCDTDGDGVITIDEILANDDVCQEILASMNTQQIEAAVFPETQVPPDEAAVADDNPAIAKEGQPQDTKDKPFAESFGEIIPGMFESQFDIAA